MLRGNYLQSEPTLFGHAKFGSGTKSFSPHFRFRASGFMDSDTWPGYNIEQKILARKPHEKPVEPDEDVTLFRLPLPR